MSPRAAAGNEKLEFYLKEMCSVVSGEQGPEWTVLILDQPLTPVDSVSPSVDLGHSSFSGAHL